MLVYTQPGVCLHDKSRINPNSWMISRVLLSWMILLFYKKLSNPDFLFGSNAVVKKSIVSSLGFYNEKFKSNFEDVDISRKILAKGWQLIYSPKARAKHIKNDSIKSVLNAFWNWHCYRYSHPKETASSLKRFFKNISLMVMSLKFFINDIKLKHYKILCLDILMFIYLPVLSTNDLFKGLHRNCIFAGDGKK